MWTELVSVTAATASEDVCHFRFSPLHDWRSNNQREKIVIAEKQSGNSVPVEKWSLIAFEYHHIG
jgi:hypothetical protein